MGDIGEPRRHFEVLPERRDRHEPKLDPPIEPLRVPAAEPRSEPGEPVR